MEGVWMPSLLYFSTGAFNGRVNGRDPQLAADYASMLDCDGLEVMVYEDWYGRLDAIAALYRERGLRCPVVHADKVIGDRMSAPEPEALADALRRFEENCRFAALLGAGIIVCHIWGVPDSDAHLAGIINRTGRLLETAGRYGLTLAAENCVCVHGSPLRHMEELAARYPAIGFTLDVRPAQFHRELPAFFRSGLFEAGHIRHIHIGDYAGGYKEWDQLYPIPHPGEGTVDFPAFFRGLREKRYDGAMTLESPCILPDRVDTDTINRDLRWLRQQRDTPPAGI